MQMSVLRGVNSKHIMVRHHHFGAESASRQKPISHYEADISAGNRVKSVFHLYILKNLKVKRARCGKAVC